MGLTNEQIKRFKSLHTTNCLVISNNENLLASHVTQMAIYLIFLLYRLQH